MKKQKCKTCERVLPVSEFYRTQQNLSGFYTECKECCRIRTRRWRAANIERIREYDRQRRKTPEWRRAHYLYQVEFYQRHPERLKVKRKMYWAIKSGQIVRQPCFKCDAPNAEAHHEDYSRPYDIVWACSLHHRELEGKVPFTQKEAA